MTMDVCGVSVYGNIDWTIIAAVAAMYAAAGYALVGLLRR